MQLQARNNSGQMGFADAPDGSFVGSSNGTCPAGYYSTSASFNPSGGGFASPFNAFICVPAPVQPKPQVQTPAAKVTVNTNVNPNINVSPQISPIFQQQFQPSNSPMGAGTSQDNSTENALVKQRQIQQDLELQQLREQLARQQQTQPTGSAPVIGTQPPTVTVPSGGVTQLPAYSQPPATLSQPDTSFQAPPLESLLNNPNVNQVSTGANNEAVPTTENKSKIWLIGLGLVAAAIMLTAHSKRRTPVRSVKRKRLATR